MVCLPSGNQTWLAGKYTISRWLPIGPPCNSWIFLYLTNFDQLPRLSMGEHFYLAASQMAGGMGCDPEKAGHVVRLMNPSLFSIIFHICHDLSWFSNQFLTAFLAFKFGWAAEQLRPAVEAAVPLLTDTLKCQRAEGARRGTCGEDWGCRDDSEKSPVRSVVHISGCPNVLKYRNICLLFESVRIGL